MTEISTQIGIRIHNFRKKQAMTLEELAAAVHKSKSTLSKYEKGEIAIDIETLYELSRALRVHVEQLLYLPPDRIPTAYCINTPSFFAGISHFYSYAYDGRANTLLHSRYDILSRTEDGRFKVIMYMNFPDFSNYQKCENTYLGYIEHFDTVTNIQLTNQALPMERASVQILTSALDSDTKWGLFNGLSTRPIMPIAQKMLFSHKPLTENAELEKKLHVSKEDIRLMKLYNMMCVI